MAMTRNRTDGALSLEILRRITGTSRLEGVKKLTLISRSETLRLEALRTIRWTLGAPAFDLFSLNEPERGCAILRLPRRRGWERRVSTTRGFDLAFDSLQWT
jgi:hypothetical protein